jgi:hypothetical protein
MKTLYLASNTKPHAAGLLVVVKFSQCPKAAKSPEDYQPDSCIAERKPKKSSIVSTVPSLAMWSSKIAMGIIHGSLGRSIVGRLEYEWHNTRVVATFERKDGVSLGRSQIRESS